MQGNRHRPDGVELRWRQIGVKGLQSDPQLPFFVAVAVPGRAAPERRRHPARCSSARLEIAGDPHRVSDWLGNSVEGPLEDVEVDWVAPHGTPGVVAAQFGTPNGLVRI